MTSLETLQGIWNSRPGGLVFAALAEGLQKTGRLDEAANVAVEGLRRWPKHVAGRVIQGRIAVEQGDLELARAAFQAAADIDGSCRAALEGLADVSGRAQYLRQAFDAWNRLAALEPEHPTAANQARQVAQKMDRPGGIDTMSLVRDVEDIRTREALSEGATSHPSIGATQPGIPAFHLELSDVPPPSAFSAPKLDAPTIPELPGFQVPTHASPNPASHSLTGKIEESSFATLEMPSFPGRTIPPPALDLPKVPEPRRDVELPPVPLAPPSEIPGADATQFFGAITATPAAKVPVQPAPKAGITGDDIEDRLDAVFGTDSALPEVAKPAAILEDPVPSAPPPITTAEFPVVKPVSDRVTGRDVEDRLGELFGASSHPPEGINPPPKPSEPAVTPTVVMPHGVVANAAVGPGAGAPVSGEDIEGRLDDLFGESVIDLTGPIHSDSHGAADNTMAYSKAGLHTPSSFDQAGETAAMGRDTTLEARMGMRGADSTTELHTRDLNLDPKHLLSQAAKGSEIDPTGSTIDLPSLDALHSNAEPGRNTRLTAEDVDSRLDELFAASEFIADPQAGASRTGFVAKTPAAHAGVTGDDIEGRLDDLFGGDSDFPVGLPTVTFAEEYLRQGHRDKAASIYRQLLDRDPKNADLRRRLNEIEGKA